MKDVNLKSITQLASKATKAAQPYALVSFIVMFALVYAFIVLRINSLSTAPVDDNAVNEQVKTSPVLRIDSQAAQQLQSLKDNSVNVQSLFVDRSNPFQ
jgi:hypothetical protein